MADPDVRWPPLPLATWTQTKDTLHRYAQILGKVRMELAPAENHWWHVPLYVGARGLSTRELLVGGTALELALDLCAHRLVIRSSAREDVTFPLEGHDVKNFYEEVTGVLHDLGVEPHILAKPYHLEDATPFPRDERHGVYDPDAANRFFRTLLFVDHTLKRFRGRFRGKSSPVHLFWHSFDLAMTRFSGRPGLPPRGRLVEDEAYSEEVISFGFWPGDSTFPEPAFYAYASPEPPGLSREPLAADGAAWLLREGGSLAVLPYEGVRVRPDPEEVALSFFESAYQAAARRAGWPVEELVYDPPQTGREAHPPRRPDAHPDALTAGPHA